MTELVTWLLTEGYKWLFIIAFAIFFIPTLVNQRRNDPYENLLSKLKQDHREREEHERLKGP